MKRILTIHEKDIDFVAYEDFLDEIKRIAVREFKLLVKKQEIKYTRKIARVLKTKKTPSQKINEIDILRLKFQAPVEDLIKEYLNIVCLFGLRQTCKELKFKYPKKLSPDINSWIKTVKHTAALKYLADVNSLITMPVVDGILGKVSIENTIKVIEEIFKKDIMKKPFQILNNFEGEALFKGRDLAIRIFNKEIKLESGFNLASVKTILRREKVVAAQWCAIIDKVTCELCASLDGKIIDINSSDYAIYHPGGIHTGCRCFINPKTKICTINGQKNIKDIKVGDLVLTHVGRFKKVSHVFNEGGYKGDFYNINVSHTGEVFSRKLQVTPEHPFYIKRNNKFQWINAKDIKINDIVKFLTHKCKRCDNLTRIDQTYCSRSCLSKDITDKQWKDDKHRENISKKTSLQLKREYKLGIRDGKKIMEMAHKKIKELVKLGINGFQNPILLKNAKSKMAKSHNNSYLEKKINWLLTKMELNFTHQHPIFKGRDIWNRARYYFVDFAFPKLKIAIECDGKYWHSKKLLYHSKRQKYIEEKGWVLLRLPEDLIKNNLKECRERIIKVYKNHTKQEQFVETKIVKIVKREIKYHTKRRYNLSVEGDESFVANGIVVHNCMWVYIKNTERPENRVINWVLPTLELLKRYAKKEIIIKTKVKNKKLKEENNAI